MHDHSTDPEKNLNSLTCNAYHTEMCERLLGKGTCTRNSGDRFRLLQTISGPAGASNTLQHRQKWTVPHRNLQVGDLVLHRGKQAAPPHVIEEEEPAHIKHSQA